MVRPKKTPASTLAISRKSSLASKSKQSKSNDIESDNESPATNNKRKLTKRLTSAGKLSTNQDEEVNDESSVSENGNDLKNNSKKKQQQQQLKEEPSDLKDDSKSIDCESAVKDKQTRTKKITNKSEKTATPDEIASQTDKEPRKRRIASLNAEFLVHYCSSSNNNNNHSNINGTNLENKKLNNCPDTVSIASSLKQELNTTNNNSNNKTNKNNKRQRILSVDSEKMKKEEASELEEANPNLKIKNNGTDKKSKKKSNNDELDESNTEKKNENFRKKNPTDEVDEEEEEEDVEEDEVEKEVAQNKTTKRKPVHTRNSASRYSKGSDNVICKKTPNKKSIKFESDVEEEEHESDQEDEEKSNNLKKVALKGRKAKRKLKKPLKKQPESESDHTDTESSVHSKKRRNTGAKRKAVDKSVVLESPQPTVRPKREAGMRASAMIIQTNEIEKTRFQYYSSNSTPAPNHSNAPGQPAPVLNVSASSKKKSNLANETNRKKAKNAEQPISKTDFQVPQSMSLFASLTAAAAVAATSKTSKTLAKSRSTNLTASSPFTSSQMNQQIATSTSRQISNTTHLNNLAGDDSSSNDVLIVMETTSATKKASQTNKTPVERTLTEDLLAEHNKLNGTLGCGSGTFSNYTREFISKWALEYKCNDEKPFPPGFIPIESFGVKILNEPQYLQNKSRFGGSSSSSSTANQVPIAPVPVATMTAPKLNQRNTNMANNSSTSPAKTTQPIIEIENKAVNEQVLSNHSTKPNNVQPPQVSQKTFSSNSNNSNEKLNSVKKKINLASSKGINTNNTNSSIVIENNNNQQNNINNKTSANITNILNENSNNGINSSSNLNDSYSNNNNSNDNNLNYFPNKFISA